MYTRSVNSSIAGQVTAAYAAQQAPTSGCGNIFVGGSGNVSVMNTTDNFVCAGGNSSMQLLNRGNNALIQGGAGALGKSAIVLGQDSDGRTISTSANNWILNIGEGCKINGSEDEDVIFSLGANCDIDTVGGADRISANGAGTKVNGGSGNDVISGTMTGLDFSQLIRLSPMSIMNRILTTSISYLTVNKSNEQVNA